MAEAEAGGSGGTLARANGAAIAYDRVWPAAGKEGLPWVVFIHGFRSDREGGKALALEAHCRGIGLGFVRFDLSGHGGSGGAFEACCIGSWADDVIDVIDQLTEGRLILVGSSMGGWLMLLAALARPKRIAGLIGIAAAPDFTEDSIVARLDAAQRESLASDGFFDVPSPYSAVPYTITAKLLDDGRARLLLRGTIALDCPVVLLHGLLDPDVPWNTSMRLMQALRSPSVRVSLIKDGDHRLSRPEDLDLLRRSLDWLLEAVDRDPAEPRAAAT